MSDMQTTIDRTVEILEALEARKGKTYAKRVQVFVNLSNLMLVTGTDIELRQSVQTDLLVSFGFPTVEGDEPRKEFLEDCCTVGRATLYKVQK